MEPNVKLTILSRNGRIRIDIQVWTPIGWKVMGVLIFDAQTEFDTFRDSFQQNMVVVSEPLKAA